MPVPRVFVVIVHCVRLSCFAPRAAAGSLGRRIERRPRTACACDRAGRPAVGPLAVSRRSLRSGGSIDTPPRDARSGPARSGAIGLRPLGGFDHPPPRQAEVLLLTLGYRQASRPCSRTSEVWAGGSSIRRCRGWPLAPPAAGPGRASRAGVSMAPPSVSCEGGEQRGAPARIALSGRGRRSMRARARGRPGPHPATRGTGKQEASRSGK